MDPTRAVLKMYIWNERKHPWQKELMCEICDTHPATDMHEHWISRGQARGNEALGRAILISKYNVSALCNYCNLNRGETNYGRKLLRTRSIVRYGEEAIRNWIRTLPFSKESTRDMFEQQLNALTPTQL